MKNWEWVAQYGVAVVLALLLGAILGSIDLFKETALGGRGLTASDLVRFLGYGTALVLIWLMAGRAMEELPEDRRGSSFLRQAVVPLATLIVLSAGYGVLLLLLGPFLDRTARSIYNWLFVLSIAASALWLAVNCFQNSSQLVRAVGSGRRGRPARSQSSAACPQCGARVDRNMKFCSECGQNLVATCRSCGERLRAGQKFCGACGTAVS